MFKWNFKMLKFLVFCFITLLVACGTTSKQVDMNTIYDPNLEPSCYVEYPDWYWNWRDKLPKLKKDEYKSLNLAQVLLGEDAKNIKSLGSENLSKYICENGKYFSETFTKVLNFNHANIPPIAVHDRIMFKLRNKNLVNLEEEQLNQLISAALTDLRGRYTR